VADSTRIGLTFGSPRTQAAPAWAKKSGDFLRAHVTQADAFFPKDSGAKQIG
jgi:hypothetical protein